jgi:hypothetical protein
MTETKRASGRRCRSCRGGIVFVLCLLSYGFRASGADWQAGLSKDPSGKFPPLRPLRAKYNFGWSGFTAAIGETHFTKPSEDRYLLEATGRTIGLVRALWRFDVNYRGLTDADTLLPIELTQNETFHRKKITTQLAFTNSGVTRSRSESTSPPGSNKPKQFNFPNLFDLQSALLYLRSQPLKDRNVYRIVVYPATTPYLATLTVTGHEKISVRAGSYNAIKLDLQLNKVGKNLVLEPHKKFKRATVWISDDADRLILRIEAQIFVGTVFAELQSVQFDTAKR